ncbi:unnamed protein product [Dibothriocephalus latus]|uniref:Uncharacterized protein n=1 Tax=Dibothriocephalus latus TaxID=60516 RepID=A0A3P7LPC4_DIBLA|nr:unnamed protein product [Dibothriocephalus latus]
MKQFGCAERHAGIMAHVIDNGTASKAFASANDVRQDYVLVLTIFRLIFPAKLMDTNRYACPGIRLTYKTDGHLFKSRHMRTPKPRSLNTVPDFLFVKYCI